MKHYREEIDRALAEHSNLEKKLKTAIAERRLDSDSGYMSRGDQCTFGRWFLSLPPKYQKTRRYLLIKVSHAQLHRAAADVIKMLAHGDVESAQKVLVHEFAQAHNKLIFELEAWKL